MVRPSLGVTTPRYSLVLVTRDQAWVKNVRGLAPEGSTTGCKLERPWRLLFAEKGGKVLPRRYVIQARSTASTKCIFSGNHPSCTRFHWSLNDKCMVHHIQPPTQCCAAVTSPSKSCATVRIGSIQRRQPIGSFVAERTAGDSAVGACRELNRPLLPPGCRATVGLKLRRAARITVLPFSAERRLPTSASCGHGAATIAVRQPEKQVRFAQQLE
mmetsp:Transcript_3586/g.7807  ORF Transcript_3586/g.7807 Transcript_3586/m.7807 type:complete len:214 (+) Transcript_3586:452-1093(+)